MSIDGSTVIAGAFAFATAIAGALLQRANEQNIKLRESLNKKKQKFYAKLLEFLQDLIDGVYDSPEEKNKEALVKVREIFQEAVHYASPEVIKSFGDLMQHFYLSDETSMEYRLRGRKLYFELAVKIRKDLGHSSFLRRESWLDLMRISIKDISLYVPKKYSKDKSRKTHPAIEYEGKKIR